MDFNSKWNKPDQVPQVDVGGMTEFVVAVYRAHSGKVYSFAATYLNGYRLNYQDCPKGKDKFCDECEEGCPTTGWFVQTGDDDDAIMFHGLSLKDGDALRGWRTIPQWVEQSSAKSDAA